jgi:prepilin-type N-terminal cleavage/methylation domain-containing protein
MNPMPKKKIAGFTLIELMIAMAVTMVLLGAAVTTFRDASQSNQMVTEAADMTDNLRGGLNLIVQDLQQAGTGIPTGGIPIPYTPNGSTTAPCGTTPPPNRPVLTGAFTFPQCNSVLPSIEPGQAKGPLITAPDATAGNVNNPNSFTDEITVLYADNTAGLDLKPVNQPATANPPSPGCPNGSMRLTGTLLQVTFDVNCVNLNNAGITVQTGDLVMFNNSLGTTVMTVTSVAGQTLSFAPGDPLNLNGRTDPNGTINQLMPTGCGGAPACFPPTIATRVWMITYYLDNITSPPFVRLVRQVNFNAPTPVGETLENMQFTYNFVDGVTNPSNQPIVPVGNSEAQIRSVNVFLGARSSYMVHRGSKVTYARNNLVTQVSLRSMAYYDRYQ